MESLPVWKMFVIVAAPLTVAYLLRFPLQPLIVDPKQPIHRSSAQFRFDFVLFFMASLLTALAFYFVHGFPFLKSGILIIPGIMTVGLFASIDLAMERERSVIMEVRSSGEFAGPPERFTPLTRRFSLVASAIIILVSGVVLLIVLRDISIIANETPLESAFGSASRDLLIELAYIVATLLVLILNLIISYSNNLRMLFQNETDILQAVSEGELGRFVPVATTDELGIIAGHTNSMIRGLRDSERMREGLMIASEVQQNFLPDQPPAMEGLDIAGISIFSDETGGDFYDYIPCTQEKSCLGIAVGDVSGHGIGAALLMASSRSLIRQSVGFTGAPGDGVALANRHLTRDTSGTGRFLTLFMAVLDHKAQRMTWVNAGHIPPLLFDPLEKTISKLAGGDIPMGVEEEWSYMERNTPYPTQGQILVMGTDGIWEAMNPRREMFGDMRVEEVLRENHAGSAREIADALIAAVKKFQNGTPQDDDLTVVVVKGV